MSEKINYTVKKISPMAKVIDDYTSEAKKVNTINAFGAADITMARPDFYKTSIIHYEKGVKMKIGALNLYKMIN